MNTVTVLIDVYPPLLELQQWLCHNNLTRLISRSALILEYFTLQLFDANPPVRLHEELDGLREELGADASTLLSLEAVRVLTNHIRVFLPGFKCYLLPINTSVSVSLHQCCLSVTMTLATYQLFVHTNSLTRV